MSKKITEKFTERAKKALYCAAREAKSLGSNTIDTEHILLGILNDQTSVASKILNNYQMELGKVRESVIGSSDPATNNIKNEDAFTESSQEALAAAALQAYLLGSSYVGTEHIICGLAKTSSGLACHILRSFGVTYEAIKAKIDSFSTYAKDSSTNESQTPLLNTYSRDLTALAASNDLDPVIGREEEIARVLQILARRTKNNPVLLGEAGVGKTAIAEGLAQKIVKKEVPQHFFETRLVSLDLNALVAGTRFRGDFEERLLGFLEEIKSNGNIVLFIDEIHTLIGAGGAGGALDAANILKPALSRGELHCIGATTTEEYSQFIEEDSALERRFQPVLVMEPDEKTAINILKGLRGRYESFHRVKINKTALTQAVSLAQRYLVDRNLPDSAIDIVDEAASKKAVTLGKLSKNALKIEDNISEIRNEKDKLIKNEIYDEALQLRIKEKNLIKKLSEILKKDKNSNETVVNEKDIAAIVSTMTGIPVEELTEGEAEKLLNLDSQLNKKIVGQKEIITQITSTLRRSRVGLVDPDRPLGSFIFLGTSGVGKTLVAKTLAEILFKDSESLIQLDMSEFSEKHTVARLVGAPPGYVGFETGGELSEKLKHHPYSVILLDEIEKAHPEIFNILLQVLDAGKLTDGRGRVVNFRNSIIIMTSNVGSHLIKKEGKLGFSDLNINKTDETDARYKDVSSKLIEELKKNFKVEFLNRVDSTLIFRPLTMKDAKQIAKLLLREVKIRLRLLEIKLNINEKVYHFLAEKSFSPEYGARELRRTISEIIENPLSEKILKGEIKNGQKVEIKVADDSIVIG